MKDFIVSVPEQIWREHRLSVEAETEAEAIVKAKEWNILEDDTIDTNGKILWEDLEVEVKEDD